MSFDEGTKKVSVGDYQTQVGLELATQSYIGRQEATLKRKLGRSSVLSIAYLCVTTWTVYSTTLSTALVAGGLNVLFWGLLICTICNVAGAASLAEIASLHPLGNQAQWAFILAPPNHRRALAYFTNWLYLIGFMLLVVTVAAFMAQIVLAMGQMNNPTYAIASYQVSLLMNAWTLFACLFSIVAVKVLAKANTFSLVWNLCGFLLMSLFIVIQSRGHYNTPKQAFIDTIDHSGWHTTFVPWVVSLCQSAISTTAWDAVSHFSSEMHHPQRDVPFGMFMAIGLNGFVGLLYAVVFVFCLPPDAIELLSTPMGFPFAQYLYNLANQSRIGTVFLLLVIVVPMTLAMTDVIMATARIACSFARQGGLPSIFANVHQGLDAPLPGLALVLIVNLCLAYIYVGSTAAFAAFASAPAVLLGWTYSIIAAYMLFVGRPMKKLQCPFSLGPVVGPMCNVVTVAYNLCITVFLCLPSSRPVTPQTMNYTSAILAASLLFPVLCWIMYARHNYKGPHI